MQACWVNGRPIALEEPAISVLDRGFLLADGRIEVLAATAMPGFGVFPSSRADAVWPVLADLFPGAHLFPHVAAATLALLRLTRARSAAERSTIAHLGLFALVALPLASLALPTLSVTVPASVTPLATITSGE